MTGFISEWMANRFRNLVETVHGGRRERQSNPTSQSRAKGIDVSHHQQDINWPKVAASGISFALIKATESVGIKDRYFRQNVLGANQAGILCGAYHLLHVSHPATPQVSNFVDTVRTVLSPDQKGEACILHLPMVLDLEGVPSAQGAAYRKVALDWLVMVEATFKEPPMVYANLNTWRTELTSGFEDFPVWLAEYAPKPAASAPKWTFWQQDQWGRVPGIATDVDLDIYCGSVADLRSEFANSRCSRMR